MKLSVSNIYHCDEKDQFKYLKECGFDGCDFVMNQYFSPSGKMGNIYDVTDSQIQEHLMWLRELAYEAEFKIIMAHSAGSGHPSRYAGGEDEIVRRVNASIQAAHYLGTQHLVVHPFINPERKYDKFEELSIQQAIEFYKRYIPALEKYDVYCCIENMFHSSTVHRHICPTIISRASEIVRVCDECGDRFRICLDVGHAVLTQDDPAEYVRICGDRLVCLHTHDNDGINDLHTFPYCAHGKPAKLEPMRVDWTKFMQALKEVGYKGALSFEISAPGPAPLKAAGLRYLAAIGRHLSDIFENYEC